MVGAVRGQKVEFLSLNVQCLFTDYGGKIVLLHNLYHYFRMKFSIKILSYLIKNRTEDPLVARNEIVSSYYYFSSWENFVRE